MKTITESDFINLANHCVGTGLLATGNANFQLAQIFAKQQSIEFLDWKEKNGWCMSFHGTWYKPLKLREPNQTTEQLYTQFTEHQTKTNA